MRREQPGRGGSCLMPLEVTAWQIKESPLRSELASNSWPLANHTGHLRSGSRPPLQHHANTASLRNPHQEANQRWLIKEKRTKTQESFDLVHLWSLDLRIKRRSFVCAGAKGCPSLHPQRTLTGLPAARDLTGCLQSALQKTLKKCGGFA